MKNILKRVTSPIVENHFKLGEDSLDSEKLLLTHTKEKVRLTIREKDLLLYLLKQNKQTIKRDDILDNLWETNDYFTGRSLDVFMSRLRKYFPKDDRIKFDSIRGIGFKVEFPF